MFWLSTSYLCVFKIYWLPVSRMWPSDCDPRSYST